MKIQLPHEFTPRDYQKPVMKAILEDEVKRAVCVWHRRSGKDKTFVNILTTMMAQRKGSYVYYFPTSVDGRNILWTGMDREGFPFLDHFPPEFIRNPNNQEMSFWTVTGSHFRVRGTDELKVVGVNPVGIVYSETSLQNPLAWEYSRPILAENGGWAIFNGTPRGRNWFYKLFNEAQGDPDWFTQLLTVEDTGAISEDALEKERRTMAPELFQQEFYCDWTVGMPGAIYAAHVEKARNEGRVSGEVCHFEGLPVYSAFDIGAPVNTKLWFFQPVGDKINFLESISGGIGLETPDQWAKVIKDRPYNYGGHFLPHDSETLWHRLISNAGISGAVVVPRQTWIWDGINEARQNFSRCHFNREGCEDGLEALDNYHSKEERDGVTIKDIPVHDWSSHYSDAFSLAHQAIRRGMLVDRSAVPEKARSGRKPRVITNLSRHRTNRALVAQRTRGRGAR